MEISVTAWEKHKPQGTAGIRYPPTLDYTMPGGLRIRRKEGDAAGLCIEPALQNEGGGELVDYATANGTAPATAGLMVAGGIVARRFEGSVSLDGGEALIPQVDDEAGAIRGRGVFLPLVWRLGDERFELVDEAMDALGLAAAIAGEVQWVADDNAGAPVTARETEDRALVAAGLAALDGEERLRDAERVGERDTDAARADIEA
jgi:hypothetical protein